MNIFTYGTLMFGRIWSAVVKGTYGSNEARLFGYQRRKIKGEMYPALIPAGQSRHVDGIIYFGVDSSDMVRLDQFEGQYYTQKDVVCQLPDNASVSARVYLFRPEYSSIVAEETWTPEWFENFGLQRFMGAYEGYNRIETR